MKKFSIVTAALFVAFVIMTSCTAQQSAKADLKTDVDSVCYAIAISQTQGIDQYLSSMEIDSTVYADFIKGLSEGMSVDKNNKKKKAYLTGVQIGNNIGTQMVPGITRELYGSDTTKTINKSNILAGFIAGILKKDMKMKPEEAQMYAQTQMQKIKTQILEKEYAPNKAAGEKFLAENKTKEGVVILPSGVQYKVITEGKGAKPTKDDQVKVNYKGTLIDGTEFDSSAKQGGQPAQFGVSYVIAGWTEVLQLMPVGSKWEVYIPQELAYGSQDRGTIKPFSALVFEVELVDIVK